MISYTNFIFPNPEYDKGFQDGYEKAKQELLDMVKSMQIEKLMATTTEIKIELNEN